VSHNLAASVERGPYRARAALAVPIAGGPVNDRMPSAFIPPCIPTRAYKVLAGPDWVHEIKRDGYRLQVRRDGTGDAAA
jgi:ATP-dependent DNA ligase